MKSRYMLFIEVPEVPPVREVTYWGLPRPERSLAAIRGVNCGRDPAMAGWQGSCTSARMASPCGRSKLAGGERELYSDFYRL